MTIFNIEISNAFFISANMQRESSINTSILLILVDLLQMLLSLCDLTLMLNSVGSISQKMGIGTTEAVNIALTIAAKYPELPARSHVTDSLTQSKADMWFLSFHQRHTNTSIPKSGPSKTQVAPMPAENGITFLRSSRGGRTAPHVLPKEMYAIESGIDTAVAIERITQRERYLLLDKVLQIMFFTEFVLLTEFIEVFMPVMYNPKEGWRVNYGFWIRMTIVAFVVNLTNVGQAPYFVKEISLSKAQLVLVAGCTSTIFTACAIPIVAHTMFPVPFFLLTFGPMYYLVQIIVFRLVTGARIFRQMLTHPDQLLRYMTFVTIQLTLLFTYPAYEALFRTAQGTQYQLPVILLLPVIKVFFKNMVLRCTVHLEDMMPEAAIFTVDYFNAIYVATCMQSATSTAAITVMTIADLSQSVLMIYGLHIKTRTIRTRIGMVARAFPRSCNLLVSTSMVCRDPMKFDNQFCSSIRIRSSFPHQLSEDDEELLDKLESTTEAVNADNHHPIGPDEAVHARNSPKVQSRGTPSGKDRSWCARKRSNTVYPVASVVVNQLHLGKKKSTLREALEALFTIECLVVTAYLEAVVPLFYAAYMLMMVHFPSAKYHSELAGITRDNVGTTVVSVFVFGLLQILSFAMLAVHKPSNRLKCISPTILMVLDSSCLVIVEVFFGAGVETTPFVTECKIIALFVQKYGFTAGGEYMYHTK
ncbi:hypothetical protein ON010_g13204 [Phytophthora cinnamomi]|nr:hypothetical protein ON010_g13204 [Phytophthora cinnamomi]